MVRATWTITSIDRDSWARIAASGQLGAACITSVSSRRRASIGPLAWHVANDPSWPVFMACTSPVTSLPRTSPTTSRSGRSRSAVRTSSSRGIGRMPSGVAGRASRRTTCALVGCSSAVSSRTMMRSPGSVRPSSDASNDVLPLDVAPLTTTLHRARSTSVSSSTTRRRREGRERKGVAAEASDRHRRAIDGDRTDDGAHPRPVGQPGIDDRVGAVEAPPQRCQHPFEHDRDRRGRQWLRGVELAARARPTPLRRR